MEEEIGRSKAASANKQIESKAGEIMQEGDKRPKGETVVARDFYCPPPSLLCPRDYQINSQRERERERVVRAEREREK